jgi:hypothetical protein
MGAGCVFYPTGLFIYGLEGGGVGLGCGVIILNKKRGYMVLILFLNIL